MSRQPINRQALYYIARKDLTAVLRSRMVVLPMVLVPIILLVIMPSVLGIGLQLANNPSVNLREFEEFIGLLPPALQQSLMGYSLVQQVTVAALVYFLAPLYLIVPLMVSSVIAADSFAGEKERKTLEALLYTPTTDRELFMAKIIGPWLAAIAVGWLSFVAYCVVGNIVGWLQLERLLFPNALWLALAFWLGPAVAGLGLGLTVWVSARVSTFQEAFQLGGLIVLPIIALVVGQASGVMYFSVGLVLLLGLVVWLLNIAVLRWAFAAFRRNALAERL